MTTTSPLEGGRFRVWLTTKNGLLFRKLVVAFGAGFLGVFLPAILHILDSVAKNVDVDFSGAFWISLISGAVAAGIRAIFALIPGINIESTDQITSIGSNVDTVTVSAKGGEVAR